MSISLTSSSLSYSQNFDLLTTAGAWVNDSTITGWSLFRSMATATQPITYSVADGSSNSGGYFSFGSKDGADRALGSVASTNKNSWGDGTSSPAAGSEVGYIAFSATNDTGTKIGSVAITFNGEQWRDGGNSSQAAQTMKLQYGFGATFSDVDDWITPGSSFDWTSPVHTTTASSGSNLLDGNAAGQVMGVGGTLALDWAIGQTFWVRWVEKDDAGSDHGLAIDDFSLTATLAGPSGPELVYSGSLNESAAFDGTIATGEAIRIALSVDTFTGNDGDVLDATVSNLPTGLVGTVVRTSATTAELRVTGTVSADAHDDDASFTVTFADTAFTGGSAAAVAHATQAGLWIDFAAPGVANSTQTFKPHGQGSDASTAIALDANWMVVGDDEANVLRVYNRVGGDAVKEWSYEDAATGIGFGGELDLEGGTRIGDVYYFTGSSSNSKSGADDPNREKIFSVRITGTGAETEFTGIDTLASLEQKLVDWDAAHSNRFGFSASSSASGGAPEKVSGFSIEGLTAKAGEGNTLLLGLRAPQTSTVTRDKALVAELKLGTDGSLHDATVGEAWELNLGGRGIRSIELVDGIYYILAGPAGAATAEVANDFRLFTWDGSTDGSTQATGLVELAIEGATLDALRDGTGGSFESIVDVVTIGGATYVQLLQDNGDTVWPGQTQVSKDLADELQQFQGNWVKISGTVTDAAGPVLAGSSPADGAGTASTSGNIVLRFDEGVKIGSGNFFIYQVGNDVTPVATIEAVSSRVTVAYNTVTIDPPAALKANTGYYVKADAGTVVDHYGNSWSGIADATTLDFTTAQIPLLITEINSNAAGGDYFELYNYGASDIDLANWTWKNINDDAKVATFGNTVIKAGAKLVVLTKNGGTDVTQFKTAWGLDASVDVVAVGDKGLGQNEGVVLFDASGAGVAGINYGTTDPGKVGFAVAPLKQADATQSKGGHAGAAVAAGTGASAVWDGISVTDPTYTAAVSMVDGAKAQAGNAASIGSPGSVPKPAVLITEINSSATGGDFFELYNYGTTTIDLTGWKVIDSAAKQQNAALLPDGTMLAAGAKLIVLADGDNVATFREKWNNLSESVQVVSVKAAGLGKGDAVVVFDANHQVVAAVNYGAGSISASDGTQVAGIGTGSAHAGAAVGGGSDGTSLVWDGLSTATPTYKAAEVGHKGAYAQANAAGNIGSPGLTETPPGAPASYLQQFNDAAGFADFKVFSKDANTASNVDWRLNNGVAEINGYNSTVPADDWLISKAFNLNATSTEFLSFTTATQYSDGGLPRSDDQLKLFYSVDYTGTGNPSAATWTELSFAHASTATATKAHATTRRAFLPICGR